MTIRSSLLGRRAGDTLWAVAEQLATLTASTLSFLLLGRHVAAVGYGAFVGLYALMGPFLAFTQSGIVLGILEHAVKERHAPSRVARSCLSLVALNASIGIPIVAVVAFRSIESMSPLTILLFLVLEFVVNGVLMACGALIQALNGFGPAARLRTASAVSRAALLAGLAVTETLSLFSFALGQTLLVAGVTLVALSAVSDLGLDPRLGRVEAAHLRSAFLYGLGIAASVTQSDGDKFVMNAVGHQADAGRYGLAYRLTQVAILPLSALASATHVSFLDDGPSPRAQVARSVRLSLVALPYALAAALVLALLAPFVPGLVAADFEASSTMLRLLTPVIVLRGLGMFPMNGIMGLGRNDLRTKILIANASIALGLYAVLVPGHSWKGALVATLVSEISLCGSAWVGLLLIVRRPPRAMPPGVPGRADRSVGGTPRRSVASEPERLPDALEERARGESLPP